VYLESLSSAPPVTNIGELLKFLEKREKAVADPRGGQGVVAVK